MPFYPSGRGPEDRSGIYIQSYRVRISRKVLYLQSIISYSGARWRHTFLSPFLAANRSLAVPILYGDTSLCDMYGFDQLQHPHSISVPSWPDWIGSDDGWRRYNCGYHAPAEAQLCHHDLESTRGGWACCKYRIQYTQYKERRNTDGTDLVFSKF